MCACVETRLHIKLIQSAFGLWSLAQITTFAEKKRSRTMSAPIALCSGHQGKHSPICGLAQPFRILPLGGGQFLSLLRVLMPCRASQQLQYARGHDHTPSKRVKRRELFAYEADSCTVFDEAIMLALAPPSESFLRKFVGGHNATNKSTTTTF